MDSMCVLHQWGEMEFFVCEKFVYVFELLNDRWRMENNIRGTHSTLY